MVYESLIPEYFPPSDEVKLEPVAAEKTEEDSPHRQVDEEREEVEKVEESVTENTGEDEKKEDVNN